MYEFLKQFFGTTEDGNPGVLTFDELAAKLNDAKDVSIVNLKDGGYVSKDKFDSKVTELTNIQKQLADANAAIQSYKDMDIDGIKRSAQEWEDKYAKETAALQEQLATQENEFAAKTYLGNFRFANDLVRDQVFQQFMGKKFTRDGDKFLGADDFMKSLQEKYPTAFAKEPEPEQQPEPQQQKAPFYAPNTKPEPNGKPKRTLAEIMQYHNEHPNAKIEF